MTITFMAGHGEKEDTSVSVLRKPPPEPRVQTFLDLLADYFDFFIADFFHALLTESSETYNHQDWLEKLRETYLQFWKIQFSVEHSTETIQQSTDILKDIHYFLNQRLNFPDFLHEETVNLVVSLSESLFETVLQNRLEITKEAIESLRNILEEVVLVNYFDYFILGFGMKILLYSERVPFALIHELRIELVEFFRNSLFDTKNTLKLYEIFEAKKQFLTISDHGIHFISSIILSFISTIAQSKSNWKTMIERCKENLKTRSHVIKNYLNIPAEEDFEPVFTWIQDKVQHHLFKVYFIDTKKQSVLTGQITDELKKLLDQKQSYEKTVDVISSILQNLGFQDTYAHHALKQQLQQDLTILCNIIAQWIEEDPGLDKIAKSIQKTVEEEKTERDFYFI